MSHICSLGNAKCLTAPARVGALAMLDLTIKTTFFALPVPEEIGAQDATNNNYVNR